MKTKIFLCLYILVSSTVLCAQIDSTSIQNAVNMGLQIGVGLAGGSPLVPGLNNSLLGTIVAFVTGGIIHFIHMHKVKKRIKNLEK